MNNFIKSIFLIVFAAILFSSSLFAQSVLFSATPSTTNKGLFSNKVASHFTFLNGGYLVGRFNPKGGVCKQAPSGTFSDSLASFNFDSLKSNNRACLTFFMKADSGYELLTNSISTQIASTMPNVKYRVFFSVDGGYTINMIDTDFVATNQQTCSSTNLPVQTATFKYLIKSDQRLDFYLYFFNSPIQSEVNVFNVTINGCVLPNNATVDCKGDSSVWLSPPPKNKYSLLYTEDFTSGATSAKINAKNWATRGYGGFGGLMKDTNVYLANNMLHLKYTKQDTNYIGGGVQSLNQFHYGYYETYMKAYIGASNFHQTFWLIGTNNNWNKDSLPVNNMQVEVDALQMESYISNPPFASYFRATNEFAYYNHAPSPLYDDALPYLGEDLGAGNGAVIDSGWIKVGLEWLPDSMKLYYNDTLRQIFLIPKSCQHHGQLGIQFSGLPTPKGYSTTFTANMSCPAGAEMLVDWFKFYAPNTIQPNLDFISEGTFDYDLRPQNLHRPLCWINAQSFDIKGVATKFDTVATSIDTVIFHQGLASLKHYYTKAYKTATRQILTNIANGNYKLSAWVNCSGGQNICQMRVLSGGTFLTQNIVKTNGSWVQLVQPVTVQNNRAIVEFYSDANAGNTLNIDDVSFLRNSNDTALPVLFVDVKATNNINGASFEWKVANEENIASYTIERSLDGIHFEEIITTNATSTETYSVEDNHLPSHVNIWYYRIKAMSNDGSSIYSSLSKLSTKHSPLISTLFPNPTKELLKIIVNENDKYNVKIFDATGRQIMTKAGLSPNGNTISLNMNNLTSGNYFLELINDKGIASYGKFIKQ